MLIKTVKDLNNFVVANNAAPESIIDKLVDSKTLVSAKMAKLILSKIKPSNT